MGGNDSLQHPTSSTQSVSKRIVVLALLGAFELFAGASFRAGGKSAGGSGDLAAPAKVWGRDCVGDGMGLGIAVALSRGGFCERFGIAAALSRGGFCERFAGLLWTKSGFLLG